MMRRFPPSLCMHLDRLCGDIAPLQLYQPPDRFETRIEFEYDVESSLALAFPLRRLTADLATFLASRDGGVQRFSLWLEHERRDDSQVVVGLLAPEREAAMLFELARGRLEQAVVRHPCARFVWRHGTCRVSCLPAGICSTPVAPTAAVDATARAPACTSRRRGGAGRGLAARPSSGARFHDRLDECIRACAAMAAPGLAVACSPHRSRAVAEAARRSRTHRVRLVGRRRRASRLLRGRNRERPTGVGVSAIAQHWRGPFLLSSCMAGSDDGRR